MSKIGRHTRQKQRKQRKKLIAAVKIAGAIYGPAFRKAAKRVKL